MQVLSILAVLNQLLKPYRKIYSMSLQRWFCVLINMVRIDNLIVILQNLSYTNNQSYVL